MASIFAQENLTANHQTAAANKPLNQTVRALQPKTPGNNLKTSLRAQNDENTTIQFAKAAKHALVTPGPAPRTAPRAILGAKTVNAKGQAFQTPAPEIKTTNLEKTNKRASSARRTIKKKIYVEPEQSAEHNAQEPEEESEPDSGFAPPPITPLPDPPLEFDYDQTYTALRPENFNRGVGEIYFQSPKDENGFSISLKKIEEEDRKSLQRDLDKILEETDDAFRIIDLDEVTPGTTASSTRPLIQPAKQSSVSRTRTQESNISTLRSRSAAEALLRTQASSNFPRTHARLPSAATAETVASKQKRKSTWAIFREEDSSSRYMAPLPSSRGTIGFPKARKAPSILPRMQDVPSQRHRRNSSDITASGLDEQAGGNGPVVSPRKFVELYGEPSEESDLWCQLKETEIRHRRRRGQEDEFEEPIFDFDPREVDRNLCFGFGVNGDRDDADDFELTLD